MGRSREGRRLGGFARLGVAIAHRIWMRAMETGGFSPNAFSVVSSCIDPSEDVVP